MKYNTVRSSPLLLLIFLLLLNSMLTPDFCLNYSLQSFLATFQIFRSVCKCTHNTFCEVWLYFLAIRYISQLRTYLGCFYTLTSSKRVAICRLQKTFLYRAINRHLEVHKSSYNFLVDRVLKCISATVWLNHTASHFKSVSTN